jgi:hypothetical protein
MKAEQSLHEHQIERLKQKYELLGYRVIIQPAPETMPISLGSYTPDLLAIRPDSSGGIVIEVKSSADRISVDRLSEVAEKVKSLGPDWRFLLATPDDIVVPDGDEYLPTSAELVRKLDVVETLMRLNDPDPAILYLYAVFEGAMRAVASQRAIPVERLQSTRVRNSLYTLGLLDGDDYQLCKRFLAMRNKVAHGLKGHRDTQLLRSFHAFTRRIIDEWQQ